jgi:hypothetical protein
MLSLRHAAILAFAASTLLRADTALMSLVSPEAKVVGGVNVSRTLSSPFGQFLLSHIKEDDAGFREFVSVTGFDPRHNLQTVIFASPGQARHTGVVIARGIFNGPQIYAAAKTKGATTTTYNGVEIVQHKGKLLAIIDGSLAVAGEEQMVKTAIDRRAMSGPAAGAILAKAATLATRYDSWVVSEGMVNRLPVVPGAAGSPNPALESITETSGGVVFGSVIQVEGEAVTKTDTDARALAQMIQFLAGLAAMHQNNNNPNLPQIQAILQSLSVTAQGTTVKLSLRIPEADLEQIVRPKRAARKTASL